MLHSPLPPDGFLDTSLVPEDFAVLIRCGGSLVARVVPNALNGADRGLTSSALGTTRATTALPPEEEIPSYNLI